MESFRYKAFPAAIDPTNDAGFSDEDRTAKFHPANTANTEISAAFLTRNSPILYR